MKKVILVFLGLVWVSPLWGGSVINVEGKSVIIPDDAAKTKELSLNATLKMSVEKYVAEFATQGTADANYEKLFTAVYTPYKDFIKKYEVAGEREDGQFHYTRAKVEIDDVKLKGQLASLGIQPGVGGKPRVAVIVSEQNVDGGWARSYYYGWFYGTYAAHSETNFNVCEGKISDVLSGAGYPMINLNPDPTRVERAHKYQGIFSRYENNLYNLPAGDAANLIRAIDSDVKVVVTCQALAKNQGQKTRHFNSIFANVSCKATELGSNRLIGSVTAQKAVPHVDPVTGGVNALNEACADAGRQLSDKLARF